MARRSRNEEAAMDSYFYARVRGEIVGTYAQAESDLADKLRRFTALFEAQDREKRAQLSAGTITKAEYDSWLRGQVFRGERWKAVRQECVDQIHRANETTARMLNGERRALFQRAANYSAYQIEQGTRGAVNFTLYDSATVTRLIQKRPKLLPDLKVGKRRDESWNGRGIQNAITQGIIQGESIPDIAKRIAHQTGERNRAALTRQARTAMTGAQNAGRVQAMWEAEDEGIKIQKKWIATLDKKTRDAHAELDGQIVDADQPFIVNGLEIMYPGDPNADPSLVYNCRCTLGWVYPDHPSAPGARRDNETGEVIGGVTYAEWEQGKTEPTPPAAEPTIAGVTRGEPAEPGIVFDSYKPDQYDSEYQQLRARCLQADAEFKRIANDRSIPLAEARRLASAQQTELERCLEQIETQYGIEAAAAQAQAKGIEFVPVKSKPGAFDEADAIRRIAGGDLTDGSCASLGFCYVAQSAGYDVLDFRDGDSRSLFSRECVSMLKSMQTAGADTKVGVAKSYATAGKRALLQAEEGKTYYFECAKHAAIVRKRGGELEYLELQSAQDSGWHRFSTYGIDRTLGWRFGAQKSGHGGFDVSAYMLDIEDMAKQDRFFKILGYMNTDTGKQRKGAEGHER